MEIMMPFPATDRVIYNKNPLDTVICQVRFPPILKIDNEMPADFQEKIRQIYPNFSDGTEVTLDVKIENQQRIQVEEFKKLINTKESKNYGFISEDNVWKINITRNFISLSTNKYEKWEDFRGKLEYALNTFIDVYKPAMFTRIGLRYIDVIVRSNLGLGETNWSELIQPHLLGIMASNELNKSIKLYQNAFEVVLEDKESTVRVITRTVQSVDSEETCYMIDSDFFSINKIKNSQLLDKLNYFNVRAGRLFRWCIKEKLHNAMEPQKI
jgi:uncharacterized protein (TIGR04255 family)